MAEGFHGVDDSADLDGVNIDLDGINIAAC
jgi:hypothetical protein